MANSKLVWTSDPEQARKLRESGKLDTPADADAAKQTIRVATDKTRRAGKTVTVATGFQLTADSLAALAQTLKKKCGSGGTARENEIEIQGDHVARVAEELRKLGYRVK